MPLVKKSAQYATIYANTCINVIPLLWLCKWARLQASASLLCDNVSEDDVVEDVDITLVTDDITSMPNDYSEEREDTREPYHLPSKISKITS